MGLEAGTSKNSLDPGAVTNVSPEVGGWAQVGPARLVARYADVRVEGERARSGAWYEFFPRSCAREPGGHGSFRDAEERLAYAVEMGFDVIYLPPIHPIGTTNRKGPDNTPSAGPGANNPARRGRGTGAARTCR